MKDAESHIRTHRRLLLTLPQLAPLVHRTRNRTTCRRGFNCSGSGGNTLASRWLRLLYGIVCLFWCPFSQEPHPRLDAADTVPPPCPLAHNTTATATAHHRLHALAVSCPTARSLFTARDLPTRVDFTRMHLANIKQTNGERKRKKKMKDRRKEEKDRRGANVRRVA